MIDPCDLPRRLWDKGSTLSPALPAGLGNARLTSARARKMDEPNSLNSSALLDPQNSRHMGGGRAVAGVKMRILEGFVLDSILPGRHELVALPLCDIGANDSSARAGLPEPP